MVVIEIINIFSVLLSLVATGFLFVIMRRTDKELGRGFRFLAVGAFIAIALHSFAEFLETVGLIDEELLLNVMSPLVLVGSVFFIIGSYYLYKTIVGIGREVEGEVKEKGVNE